MRKFCISVFSCLIILVSFGQQFVVTGGKYSIQYFASNIIKIKFQPNGYTKTENVSDAVLLKPIKNLSSVQININGEVLSVKNGKANLAIKGIIKEDAKGFQFNLQNDEMIFGGGERALPLNRRGYRLNLYNNSWYGYSEGADNLNYSVPFITSSKGYGLFFDNASQGYLDIGKENEDVLEYGASSGEINVYVIFGNYQQILRSYHKLTGMQPLPPRWAMGNLMSRFGYTSEAQVKDIYRKMRAEGVPVDAVIYDLFWFGDSIKGTLGNLDWINRSKWPDPKKMITELKKEGGNTILVTEPFFVETSKNYAASKPYLAVDSANKPYYLTDFYFGRGGLIDIFRKDAQQWFWQFYKKQMDNGVEAWWGDLGEPEKHPSNLYHNLKDQGFNRLFRADEVHNVYGHNWTKMLYNFYAKDFPNKRLFSLNRSGFAGSQRYSIFPWTGDVSRSWSGLRAQLPILLGMSMSGVPYVHSDAGGFAGGEGDNELYIRWLQFAVFTPIFRPHGTALYDVDPKAFSFPSEAALIDEPYKTYAKQIINLRYALLPYNYSLAYQQTKYGKPLISPLYYYFSDDTTALKIGDEYMWGENILVAPILEKGIKEKKYYLPSGRWFNPMKEEFFSGNTWHTTSVSQETLLVFVKEGGFTATEKVQASTKKMKGEDLFVLYNISPNPSEFEIYFDEGERKHSIAEKEYELIKITSTGKKRNALTLNLKSNGGTYLNKPAKREIGFTIPKESDAPKEVWINNVKMKKGAELALVKTKWIEKEKETIVSFNFTGKPVSIKMIW